MIKEWIFLLLYLNVNFCNFVLVQAYFHPNIVMIRVSRDAHKMLQSALFFIRKIGQYEAFFNTLHISGNCGDRGYKTHSNTLVLNCLFCFICHNYNTCIITIIQKKTFICMLFEQILFVLLGTIRTCQKFYVGYLRRELPQLLRECKTPGNQSRDKCLSTPFCASSHVLNSSSTIPFQVPMLFIIFIYIKS